jgi:hypothetical protein
MTTWLFRGLVFAALWTLERFVQGTLVNQAGTNSSMISIGLASAMTIPAFLWGLLDGRADAKDSPDPDRRRDLAMRWILAGVIAGMVSGVACLIISKMTVSMYAGSLFSELTTITAFSALVIFIPAIIAVSVGRWLVDRKNPYTGRRREGEGGIFDQIQRDDDFVDAARETRYQDYAPGAVLAAEMASVDSPMTIPSRVSVVDRAEDATEEITKHVHEQAAKVDSKIDDIRDDIKDKFFKG